MVYFPNSQKNHHWVRLKSEVCNSIWVSYMVVGNGLLEPSAVVFQGMYHQEAVT